MHAINTNVSEQIQSSYSTDPEQTNKQKNKELPLWTLGNLCLTWPQNHAVRFSTWQHQLWFFIEKIYAALKVRIWQLTGTRLSTVVHCLDIVENYVHTMWKNKYAADGKRTLKRCHHEGFFHEISSFGADVFIPRKVQALNKHRRMRYSNQKCEAAPCMTI